MSVDEGGCERFAPAPARRLFFAVWPDMAVRRALRRVQRARCGAGMRVVPGVNLHLTLLFLGECSHARETVLRAAAGELRMPAFELVLDRTAGRTGRGRGILWSEASEAPVPLLELVASLRARAEAIGLEVERRPFLPHVTLARGKGDVTPAPHAPIGWRVEQFSLTASTLRSDGARYEVLANWSLR